MEFLLAWTLLSVVVLSVALWHWTREYQNLRRDLVHAWGEITQQEDENKYLKSVIREFEGLSTSLISKIEEVGDAEDWSNAAETKRIYYWHEIEPLAKFLEGFL